MAINDCYLKLGLETRDHSQIGEIQEKLSAAGFVLVNK
jgi:hypothetical protein